MSECVTRNQCVILSKQAKAIGKKGLEEKTHELLRDFFNDICKAVLNAEDEMFVIQWAIIQLDEGERDAFEKGSEAEH